VEQILRGSEQIRTPGDAVCMDVPEEDDAAHYGLGTRDKADYLACRSVRFG
jgi:hypothetical protein